MELFDECAIDKSMTVTEYTSYKKERGGHFMKSLKMDN